MALRVTLAVGVLLAAAVSGATTAAPAPSITTRWNLTTTLLENLGGEAGVIYAPDCGLVVTGFCGHPYYEGNLVAIDAVTGAVAWNVSVGAYPCDNLPVYHNGTVYGGGFYTLFAIDARTGTVLWHAPLTDSTCYGGDGVDVAHRHLLSLSCSSYQIASRIAAYSMDDGAMRWNTTYFIPGSDGNWNAWAQVPLVADGLVIVNGLGGVIVAVDGATGIQTLTSFPEVWDRGSGAGLAYACGVLTALEEDGQDMVGLDLRRLRAAQGNRSAEGVKAWTSGPPYGGASFPIADAERCTFYVAAGDTMTAINATGGGIVWNAFIFAIGANAPARAALDANDGAVWALGDAGAARVDAVTGAVSATRALAMPSTFGPYTAAGAAGGFFFMAGWNTVGLSFTARP